MEPLTTATGVLTLAKAAAEVSKKVHEVWKNAKDRETKQQMKAMLDSLHELKQSAAALEDENRELREKLRFKSDEYEFRNPFHYYKAHPDQPLCPKCFASKIPAPMSTSWREETGQTFRQCLVCGKVTSEDR